MEITKISQELNDVFNHILKSEKVLDFIYDELENINYDNMFFVKGTVKKILEKIETLEEVK